MNQVPTPISEMSDEQVLAIARDKLEEILTPEQQLIEMVGALVESIVMVYQIPHDFDGLSLNILRCPDTHRLMAVVMTPVDKNADGEPKVRYNVDPGKLRRADMPKIVVAH